MSGSLAIVVPVRSLSGGKTRLGPDAGPDLRAAITRAMLRKVLAAATASGAASSVLLVSPDPEALAVAGEFGRAVTPVDQPRDRSGLNPAIDLGREIAIAGGADRMLMLFADLPLLEAENVLDMAGTLTPVALASDRAGTGTNALLLDLAGPARDFVFQFGEGSFDRHLAEAKRLGLFVTPVKIAAMSFDLDTPEDLRELLYLDPEDFGFPLAETDRAS